MPDKTTSSASTTPQGTSFKELINYVTNKPNATRDEFESAIASRGYKSSDVRKLGKAYDRVQASGNEYVLHPEKGFDVFDNGTKQVSSGKRKGNKSGLDLGDLVGLGNDVSLLAGALRHEKSGYDTRNSEKKELVPETKVDNTPSPSKASSNTQSSTGTASATASAAGGSAKKPVDRAGFRPTNFQAPGATSLFDSLKKPRINDQKGFAEYAQSKIADGYKDGELNPGQATGVNGEPLSTDAERKRQEILANAHKTDWGHMLLGDLADLGKLADPKFYEDMGTMFNPAQIWNDDARQKARDLGDERDFKDRVLYEDSHPGSSYDDRAASERNSDKGMPQFGLFQLNGPSGSAFNIQNGVTKGINGTKNFFNNMMKKGADKVKFPTVHKNPLLLGQGVKEVKNIGEGVENNFLNNMTEDLDHVQFRRGGIMPSYGTPATTWIGPHSAPDFNTAHNISGAHSAPDFNTEPDFSKPYGKDFTDHGLGSPYGFNDIPGKVAGLPASYGHTATKSKLPKAAKGTKLPGGIYGDNTPDSGGEYGENEPGMQGSGSGIDGYDVLGGLVRYGLPAAYLGAEQHSINNLRRNGVPNIQAPELMTGAVQDLYHPDFSLPYRPEVGGSSQTERFNNGIARDKFQREQELNYQMQNSANKLSQKNQIIDRTNQQASLRSQAHNEQEMARANLAQGEFRYLLQDRNQTVGSLFGNVDRGIASGAAVKDANSLSQASEVIRNPEKYSESQRRWAYSTVSNTSGMPARKKGGKMKKSSFSKC